MLQQKQNKPRPLLFFFLFILFGCLSFSLFFMIVYIPKYYPFIYFFSYWHISRLVLGILGIILFISALSFFDRIFK